LPSRQYKVPQIPCEAQVLVLTSIDDTVDSSAKLLQHEVRLDESALISARDTCDCDCSLSRSEGPSPHQLLVDVRLQHAMEPEQVHLALVVDVPASARARHGRVSGRLIECTTGLPVRTQTHCLLGR
jgi:hypothetical protein